jgi:hypothetical protein
VGDIAHARNRKHVSIFARVVPSAHEAEPEKHHVVT